MLRRHASKRHADRILIATARPPLALYANAEDFRRRALDAATRQEETAWFVLNVEANVEVDITALDAMEALRAELTSRGIVFALARVKQDLLETSTRTG